MAVRMYRAKDDSIAIVEDADVGVWIGYGYEPSDAADVVEPSADQIAAAPVPPPVAAKPKRAKPQG